MVEDRRETAEDGIWSGFDQNTLYACMNSQTIKEKNQCNFFKPSRFI